EQDRLSLTPRRLTPHLGGSARRPRSLPRRKCHRAPSRRLQLKHLRESVSRRPTAAHAARSAPLQNQQQPQVKIPALLSAPLYEFTFLQSLGVSVIAHNNHYWST